jgi:hypothetical protein
MINKNKPHLIDSAEVLARLHMMDEQDQYLFFLSFHTDLMYGDPTVCRSDLAERILFDAAQQEKQLDLPI